MSKIWLSFIFLLGCVRPNEVVDATIIRATKHGELKVFFIDEHGHFGFVLGPWGKRGDKIRVKCCGGGVIHLIGGVRQRER